jgi:hypothetical protein
MGGKESKQSKDNGCPVCACKFDSSNCKRCGFIPYLSEESIVAQPVQKTGASRSRLLQAESGSPQHRRQLRPEHQLRSLIVVPFSETLPEPASAAANSAPSPEQLLSECERIVVTYLKPFFHSSAFSMETKRMVQRGDRFQINEVDFKVVACWPPSGFVSAATEIRSAPSLHALRPINKIHVLPTSASLKDKKLQGQALLQHVSPYFVDQNRHCCVGETFISQGVQFHVVAAEPSDGLVNSETVIFTEGSPIPDVRQLQLLPILESMPNADKSMTEAQRLGRFLQPFFFGKPQYVSAGQELDIFGVTFKVVSSDPTQGLVTNETSIRSIGPPLRGVDLKQQQLEEDERIARQLQREMQEEDGEEEAYMPIPIFHRHPARAGGPPHLMTFQHMLMRMHAADPQRFPYERINLLAMDRPSRQIDFLQQLIAQRNAAAAAGEGPPVGTPKETIESLPTRVFKPRAVTSSASSPSASSAEASVESAFLEQSATSANTELFTCMVCLSEYEAGEVLRTLPCFHTYHRDCIDTWLKDSNKCPVCKNMVQ